MRFRHESPKTNKYGYFGPDQSGSERRHSLVMASTDPDSYREENGRICPDIYRELAIESS